MIENKYKNLYEIADAVIDEINARKNPFDSITLVFHSVIIEQWFKAYFLKTKDNILMNVKCVTLSSFVNDVLTPDHTKHILTVSEYREYIIKALLETKNNNNVFNFFKTNDNINGINLYEFADKLSTILFNMEFDNEEITVDWQKEIYDAANEYAEADKCYTPKRAFSSIEKQEAIGKTYIIDNSFISELYREIINKVDNVTLYSLDDKSAEEIISQCNVELHAAPSMTREIEWLHTSICKKISEKNNFNLFSDFVVYAPDINDYANDIHRVFERSVSGFPEVPFRIIGETTEKHDMLNALTLLYQIANKGFFTRYDLSRFLKLPMTMFVKDIDEEDIIAFMNVVNETNTHRNGDGNEDWNYLENRLLTSLLTDGNVCLSGGEYLTHSSMDMDVTRINKLIDIIKSLTDWSNIFSNTDIANKKLNHDEILNVCDVLNALFANENKYGEEKNYLYSDVRAEAENISKIFEDTEIPATTLLLLLQDAPNRFSSSDKDVFAGGITFLSLDIDNIVPKDYVYVLGLSSKNYPRIEDKNEIDFSNNHKYTHDLDKEAFGNLLKGGEKVVVSFINHDNKTDEEFFPSMVIPSSTREEYNNYKDTENYRNEHIISLDETRDLKDLYTAHALQNKMRIANLGEENAKAPAVKSGSTDADIPKITTNQIKKYLDNTIIYKYSCVSKDSDDEDKAQTEEYEPIDIDHLSRYSIVKEMILAGKKMTDETHNAIDLNDLKNELLPKFKKEKKLPQNYDEEYFNNLFEKAAKPIIDVLQDNYKIVEPFTMKMNNGSDWILEMNTLCFCKEDGTSLSFIEPIEKKFDSKGKPKKPKYYLPPYVCALAYVANKNNDMEYEVAILAESFRIDSNKAKEKLNCLFNYMSYLENIKYMDIDLIEEIFGARDNPISNKIKVSIFELFETINNESWEYFKDKDLLNPDIDFGYSNPDDIYDEMSKEYEKLIECILFYH